MSKSRSAAAAGIHSVVDVNLLSTAPMERERKEDCWHGDGVDGLPRLLAAELPERDEHLTSIATFVQGVALGHLSASASGLRLLCPSMRCTSITA